MVYVNYTSIRKIRKQAKFEKDVDTHHWGNFFFFVINLFIWQYGVPWWPSGNRVCLPVQETLVQSLGGDLLEKEMTTHSSTVAWRIPGTEEPGGL